MKTTVNEMIAVFNFDIFKQTLRDSLLESVELFEKATGFGETAIDVKTFIEIIDGWTPSNQYLFEGDYLIDCTNNLEDWLIFVLDAANLRKFVKTAYVPSNFFTKKLMVTIIDKICEDLFDLYGFIEVE